jgi:hypothetical protein
MKRPVKGTTRLIEQEARDNTHVVMRRELDKWTVLKNDEVVVEGRGLSMRCLQIRELD